MSEKDIWEEYRMAKEAFEAAQRATSEMRSRETAALNRLNGAQKAIRKFIDAQMEAAPRDSDWGSERHKGVRVA